jgi:hypothetical protein
MKLELKENQGVPSSLLWTLAIISGVTVANIYYNQPLLNRISRDLNISEFTANLIAMCSQIGYAMDYCSSFHWAIYTAEEILSS